MSDLHAALQELGVREDTLSDAERAQLDADGQVLLRNVLTPDEVRALRERIDELGERAPVRPGQTEYEEGTVRVSDLLEKGEDGVFDRLLVEPRILAAVAHAFADHEFRHSRMNARASLPGYGNQELHADWFEPIVDPRDMRAGVGAYVCLNDFTQENGATAIVPGTHLSGQRPEEVLDDVWAPHPDEVIGTAPAGSVFVRNAYTWHRGTLNRSDDLRRAIFIPFYRPLPDSREADLPESVLERLSEPARVLVTR